MLMFGFSRRITLTILALFLVIMLGACSDDSASNDTVVCNAGERVNPITNLCEPNRSENPPSDTGDADTTQNDDTSPTDAGSEDDAVSEQDSGPEDIGNPEVTCYDIATGQIDPDVVCNFYAHTENTLYLVDPFRKTLQEVMPLPANTFDIDMHTNGILYALAGNKLYSLSPGATSWNEEGTIQAGNPNGLCLDMAGTAYITSYKNLYSFDLDSRQLSSPIGGTDRLHPHSSSGDCVINKGNTLYMSSSTNAGLNPTDDLIQIDGNTGAPTKIGSIGFSSVYALTAAWGRLYGLTGSGDLIEINSTTGHGTRIHKFTGKMWFGAASTPQR